MATSNGDGASRPVVFTTETQYPLPSQKIMVPSLWKRYQLSQLINKTLSLPHPVPFDFLVRGEILRTSLGEWCTEKGIGEEETLEIEYIESVMPPRRMANLSHDAWVSSVSCQIQGYFVTASYDGYVRCYDQSKNMVNGTPLHPLPITSLCVVPDSNSPPDTFKVATSSHDLTAQLTQLYMSTDSPPVVKPLCSLHLHTAPVSSATSNISGSHLLTSSWDGLIGVWDTRVPSSDDVLPDPSESVDRNKRRKVTSDSERAKRKAPISVLKSHTARVSKVVFGKDTGNSRSAYSCGFDSTVRSWDIESGICVDTISAAEKPMLDIALTPDGHMTLAASTDRTISVYDLRNPSATLKPAVASLSHPATPSCVVTAPSHASAHHVVSGAYDGVVRLWDLRSAKSAMIMFKAWNGGKKILGLDWSGNILGIGGEGGMEIWQMGTDAHGNLDVAGLKSQSPVD